MNDDTQHDLTEESMVKDYAKTLEKQYQEQFAGKPLNIFEQESGILLAARIHQYPMDPPDIQNQRVAMMAGLPNPQKAWLLYYAGGFARKYGMKNQASGTPPGEADLVARARNNKPTDITEG